MDVQSRSRLPLFCATLAFACIALARSPSAAARVYPHPSPEAPLHFSILHTNDLHSHFEGEGPDQYTLSLAPHPSLPEAPKGHYARLASLIMQERRSRERLGPVLLVDAGDFYSGSLFHLLGPDARRAENPELDFFRWLNYDAITLGNHEFDPGEQGLATMLSKFQAHADGPALLATNMRVHPGTPLHGFAPQVRQRADAEALLRRSLIKEFALADGKVFRVGILGLMGPAAAYGSQKNRKHTHFIGYDDANDHRQWPALIKFLQREVNALRSENLVDVVVVLFHGGHPEDEKLAAAVKGIDVLIAGHTHQTYEQPLQVNQTIVNQAGSFGQYLGVLDFTYDGKALTLLHPDQPGHRMVGADLAPRPDYQEHLRQYKTAIDQLLQPYGAYQYDTPVFASTRTLPHRAELFNKWGQVVTEGLAVRLNHLISGGEVTSLERACLVPPGPKTPVSLYFTALALIRASLQGGREPLNYQFSDIFRMIGLGFDADQLAGSPVVSFYLTQSELYKLIAMFEIGSQSLADATPAFPKALAFRTRHGLPILNIPGLRRLKDVTLGGVALEDCQPLIRLATSRFMLESLITKAKTKSLGFIDIVPKDWQGNAIELGDQGWPREFILLADYFKHHYEP